MPKRLEVLIDAKVWTEMESSTGLPMHVIVRRGLSVMKGFRLAKRDGLNHIGFVSDPSKLDREIINVL